MQDTCFCTVVTSNYLHYAIALSRSIRRQHPGSRVIVCLADRKTEISDIKEAGTAFICADELNIPEYRRFVFQYSAFELACALKPFIIEYCFNSLNVTRVFYLDSDMQVFGSLQELAGDREKFSIALTPHLVAPLPDDGLLPDYQTLALAGAYNAGFLCVHRCEAAIAFLEWWKRLLRSRCIVRPNEGYFVDQLPLDLVPGLFEGVHIHRRVGFHVGYWNLSGEQVYGRSGRYVMRGGEALTIFHFSGLDLNQPSSLSKHQTRLRLADFPVVAYLIQEYARALEEAGRFRFEGLSYGHGALSCGTPIQEEWREAVRLGHSELRHIEDPFDSSRYGLPHAYCLAGKGAKGKNKRTSWPRLVRLRSLLWD